MKILLFGKIGQLGWELNRALVTLGEVTAIDYPEVDFSNLEGMRSLVRAVSPDVIINAVAYTAVDKAEEQQALANSINALAPGILAEEAERLKATLIHYSTDYVFDGKKGSPYLETDPPNPLNVYGKSKLDGERLVQASGATYLVFRTSWVYSLRRDSFVGKVLKLARTQPVMRIVDDQISCPTWCRMLAEVTAQVLAAGKESSNRWIHERRGLYHLAGLGSVSRFEWARAILENDPKRAEQTAKDILPALTADFPTPAKRPLFSALNCDRFIETFGFQIPAWRDNLKLAMQVE
jgi:dTDP-4-dehydrorhamnose reductase